MSGESEGTRQANFITPPRAGEISTFAVTVAAASQDLRLCGPQASSITAGQGAERTVKPGLPGHYVAFEADGGDVYIVFGPTAASVTGANAPVPAVAAAVNVVGGCFKIPNGQVADWKLAEGVDVFMGYVTAAATATLRVVRTSP